jgi:2-(1,2-epoxy-1,2-dihydrophenyl)acetyl-CoA isomerase
LSPDGSSSYYLPRLIGIRRTQELMLTNRTLSAAEAVGWGLINDVVPAAELEARTSALADQLASAAKGSSSAVKKLLLASFAHNLEEQMDLEGRLIAACADSPDGREGIDAFLTKRAPKFG